MNQLQNSFFTRDRSFYSTMFTMLLVVALQNLVAYSVNMADNIMLGSYSQDALSGAATVNQVFFIVQQFAIAIGNALVVLAAQYWGEQRTAPARRVVSIAFKNGVLTSAAIIFICAVFPNQLLSLFTDVPEIIQQGKDYLVLIQWTFLLYIITNVFMAGLRAVGTVKISFYVSIVSLIINVGINYCLIFGRFGFPEMGVRGAAVGTFTARVVELLIVIFYLWKIDDKLRLFDNNHFGEGFLKGDILLTRDYIKHIFPS